MKKPKPLAKSTPKPRKNARRYDSDTVIEKGTILSTRVSHPMKERVVAAAAALGETKTSDLINIALIRLFDQLPKIVEVYRKTGVVPMSLVHLKAFMALERAPEEVTYLQRWVPHKVERLGARREETERTLTELRARLETVERMLKIKKLEQSPAVAESVGELSEDSLELG